jgi:hypothetical protein
MSRTSGWPSAERAQDCLTELTDKMRAPCRRLLPSAVRQKNGRLSRLPPQSHGRHYPQSDSGGQQKSSGLADGQAAGAPVTIVAA